MSSLGCAALKRGMAVVGGTALWGAVLFAAAGNLHWRRGWICLGLYLGGILAGSVTVLATNPELIAARGTKHADTKRFDKVFAAIYTPMFFIVPVVAGVDAVRFGWSSMGRGALWAGVVVFALGYVPVIWAMAANPFLETTVRIQADRGHRVISSGPYRFVRHPMYDGLILQNLATPLVLGSWLALAPAGAIAILVVVRTSLEDRTLKNELPGYAQYAQSTRFRLVPGIW